MSICPRPGVGTTRSALQREQAVTVFFETLAGFVRSSALDRGVPALAELPGRAPVPAVPEDGVGWATVSSPGVSGFPHGSRCEAHTPVALVV